MFLSLSEAGPFPHLEVSDPGSETKGHSLMDDSRGAREIFWFRTPPKRIFNEKMTRVLTTFWLPPRPPPQARCFFLARRGAQSGPRFLILCFLNPSGSAISVGVSDALTRPHRTFVL